ncbi:unnamed protein product [Bemisia tabaci]|uniref:Nuclear pore complex protein Nup153 n=1 Tax=Bemisia tabaci TaxID=7038 RepID=A0A9P0AE34_BEMTA|nr:unnamed protein product [Bemisia tabaci]
MVKGNSTVKNNKSVSFQPYDASNSLVKKVTSRVSELFQQPAWIGKWLAMPSPGASPFDTGESPQTDTSPGNHDLHSSAEDDLLAEQPPAKRARVPFNPQYSKLHKLTFPSPEPGPSIGQGVSPIVNHNKASDNANNISMPGPSNRMSFVASTPQVGNCISNSTENPSKTTMNGDDNCSDSSESTSGCSSLVPQDNIFKKNSSNNTNVSGEMSSLSRSRIQHSRMNPNTLAARRPSFNASSFIASSKIGASPNTSPFYSGRTMYGGASHYRRCAEVGGLFSPTHHSPNLAIRPAVSPCRTTTTTGMSSTARRILDALEQFSTPVLDAKRIPLKKSSPKTDERVRPNKRKMSELSSSIPTTPDLLRLKRKERLQDSMLAARNSSSTFSTPASDYSIREDDGETCDNYKGKIKTKRKDRDKDMNITPLDVNLPNVSLGVSALPKIDIALPPKPSPISKPIPPFSNSSSSFFKFSKPSLDTFKKVDLSKSNSSESVSLSATQTTTSNSNSPSMNFVYKPTNTMPKEKKSGSIDKSSQTFVESEKPILPALTEQQKLDSMFGKKISSPGNTEKTTSQLKPVSSSTGSVTQPSMKEEVKTASSVTTSGFSGFGDKFKKPEGSWECSACLIQNKPDATKCIACETAKPSSSGNKSAAAPITGFSTGSAFGTNSFKMPEGPKETITTSSNSSTTPVSTSTGLAGFGDKFKKPAGAWECGVCMVQNKGDTNKCVACETPKPGSGGESATGLKSSGLSVSSDQKFNFGVDKASEPKFSFGIKKDDTQEKPAISSGFKFGDNGTATIGGTPPAFSFGVPPNAKKETPAPAFNFNAPASTEPKKPDEPKINFAAPTPPKTALDVTDSEAPPAKKSLGFVNPFGSVDVKQSVFDTNKNIASPVKSQASPLLAKPNVPSFSSPTSTSVPDGSKGTSLPNSTFSFGASAFASPPSYSAATNQGSAQVAPQSQKAVQDMKIESTSTQPSATSAVALNSATASSKPSFSFDSSSVFKPPAAGFSFGQAAAAEKPKESLFGNADKPNQSLFGNIEKPKESVFGGVDKPKDSVFGGIDKPKESLFGATEAPKENVFGAAVKPQTNLFGTVENKVAVSTPQLGNSFGTSGGFAFGNTSSSAPSNAFAFGGAKPVEPAPAAPTFGAVNSNTSVFNFNASSEAAPVSASPFGAANKNTFSSPFQSTVTTTAAESKPAFSFGSAASTAPSAPASGGFSFSAMPQTNKPQGFNFSAPQSNNTPASGGFSFGAAAAPSPAVTAAPKPEQSSVFMQPHQNNVFGNPVAPNSNPSPFGAPANPAPSFGAPSQPSFNFGANSTAPAPQSVFSFGGQNANAAPSPVFGAQATNATPTFNVHVPSTFNFTGGAPPSFSATPTGAAAASGRRIKKAVRRTQR